MPSRNAASWMPAEEASPLRGQSRIMRTGVANRHHRECVLEARIAGPLAQAFTSPRKRREGEEAPRNICPAGNRSRREPVNVVVTAGETSKPREEKFEWRCWRMPSRAEDS